MCIDGKGEKKKNREQIWIKYSVSLIQPPHLWRLVSSYASEEIVSTSCWDKPENFAISSIVNLFLYRKFLKSSEIVYNRLEIKNDITKERRGLRHDVVYEVFCFGLG